ncbi:MAG: YwbE family protein [Balneolaceae bacterium]
MQGTNRMDLLPGMEVGIVLKKDQRSGNISYGVIQNILTKSATHPHGIKVRLTNGQIGRVKEIK